MNISRHQNPPGKSGSWHWIPFAYAALVMGVSSVALIVEAGGHYSGLVGAALSIGAVPALAGVIGLVVYVAFLMVGIVETMTDSRFVSALARRVK